MSRVKSTLIEEYNNSPSVPLGFDLAPFAAFYSTTQYFTITCVNSIFQLFNSSWINNGVFLEILYIDGRHNLEREIPPTNFHVSEQRIENVKSQIDEMASLENNKEEKCL